MKPFTKLAALFRAKAEPAAAPAHMTARNLTRQTVLASALELAGSGQTRRKGLLGRNGLEPGAGLWIVPCESVHTFFMRFAIDLVYLDRRYRVRKVRHAVGPWRLSACLTAHSVLELPAGTARQSGTLRGDVVELEPVINFPTGGAGSQFSSVRGARSDAYRVSASDERRRNEENWPQPFGLRRKSGHTSFSPSTVDPPQPSGSASSVPIFARNAAGAKVNNRL